MTIDLRPIRSDDDHGRAIATIDALTDRRDQWGADEDDYFLTLALEGSGAGRGRDDHPLAME